MVPIRAISSARGLECAQANPAFVEARANARAAAFRLPEPGSRIKNHAVPASSSVYAGADGFPHGRLDQVFDAAVKAAYVADLHFLAPRHGVQHRPVVPAGAHTGKRLGHALVYLTAHRGGVLVVGEYLRAADRVRPHCRRHSDGNAGPPHAQQSALAASKRCRTRSRLHAALSEGGGGVRLARQNAASRPCVPADLTSLDTRELQSRGRQQGASGAHTICARGRLPCRDAGEYGLAVFNSAVLGIGQHVAGYARHPRQHLPEVRRVVCPARRDRRGAYRAMQGARRAVLQAASRRSCRPWRCASPGIRT